MDPTIVATLSTLYLEPVSSTDTYSVYDSTNDLSAVTTIYQTAVAKYVELSESVRGFAPPIGSFEVIYKTWKSEADTQVKALTNAWQKVSEIANKLCLLGDPKKRKTALDAITSVTLDLVCVSEEYSQLLELLDVSHIHRTAVEHHKTLIQECEKIESSTDPQALVTLFDKAKAAITSQQDSITKRSADFKSEITKIHTHLLEFIHYVAKACQKKLLAPQHEALNIQIEDLLKQIQAFKKTLEPFVELSFARLTLDTSAQDKVKAFLDDSLSVPITTYEHFRQGQWHTPVTYYGVQDIVSSLTKVKQGIKKLASTLQDRIHEIAKEPKKVSTKLDNLPLDQEKKFYEACILEIERRIEEQRVKLFAKPYSLQIHSCINNAAQRESCCLNLRLMLALFAELSSNQYLNEHPEVLDKLLAFLPLASFDTTKTQNAIQAIANAILSVASLKAGAKVVPYGLRRYCEMRASVLSSTISRLGNTIILESLKSDKVIIEQIVSRVPFEQVFGTASSETKLPSRLKEIISKLILSVFFQKDSKTHPELELLLFTLTNDAQYKLLFAQALSEDPLFVQQLTLYSQLSDWHSDESTAIIKRIYSIYGSLATAKSLEATKDLQLQRFMNFMNANQKVVELNALASVAALSESGRMRLHALLPAVKLKLSAEQALYAQQASATYHAYYQYPPLPTPLIARNNSLEVNNEPLTEAMTFQFLYMLLAAVVYGELEPRLRMEEEQTLAFFIQHVSNKTLLAALPPKNLHVEQNLLTMLFIYLAKKLESQDVTKFNTKEYELLLGFITHCFSSQAILETWMKNCGSCFILAAAKRFNDLQQSHILKQGSTLLFSQKNIGWNYNLFLKLVQTYQAVKNSQAASQAALQAQIDEVQSMASKISAPDKSNLIGQLIHVALQKGLLELVLYFKNSLALR